MIEQMFYYEYPSGHGGGRKNRLRKSQQHAGVWRLKAMRQQLPTFLAITARTAGMVALAMLLILVLLPAMLAAQAASPG
jgi:hypothetical protein